MRVGLELNRGSTALVSFLTHSALCPHPPCLWLKLFPPCSLTRPLPTMAACTRIWTSSFPCLPIRLLLYVARARGQQVAYAIPAPGPLPAPPLAASRVLAAAPLAAAGPRRQPSQCIPQHAACLVHHAQPRGMSHSPLFTPCFCCAAACPPPVLSTDAHASPVQCFCCRRAGSCS